MTATFKVDTSGLGATTVMRAVQVQAFDRVEVTVPAASDPDDPATAGTVTAQVQPGEAGQARLVFFTASAYPVGADDAPQVSFTVDVGGTDVELPLDGPFLLVGAAIGDLVGAVQEIDFSNASGADVEVQVLVGREAVATP